jgi:hypothetical protein
MEYTKAIRYRTMFPERELAEGQIKELTGRVSYLGGRIYDIHGREAEGWIVEAYFSCPEEIDEVKPLPEPCSVVYIPAFMYEELGWEPDPPPPSGRRKGGLRAI